MQALDRTSASQTADKVVLFDGVCRLCSAWARFLIRCDRKKQLRLASVQSDAGQSILESHGFPTGSFHTMLFFDNGVLYERSSAFIRVMTALPMPWKLASVVRIIPLQIRDWVYDRIARNRYRLFGRFDVCAVPPPDHEGRYL